MLQSTRLCSTSVSSLGTCTLRARTHFMPRTSAFTALETLYKNLPLDFVPGAQADELADRFQNREPMASLYRFWVTLRDAYGLEPPQYVENDNGIAANVKNCLAQPGVLLPQQPVEPLPITGMFRSSLYRGGTSHALPY